MRQKAGPAAIVVAVIVVVAYFVIMYNKTMVRHAPANYIPAQAAAHLPANQAAIHELVRQRWGTNGTADQTPTDANPTAPRHVGHVRGD